MVRHTLKILQQILQDFKSVSDHFATCEVNGLKFEQRKLLLNAFITSQFFHAPVVWIFHNRKLNNHINRIHERALRILH